MIKRDKSERQTRSDKYQYLILETTVSSEFLESFANGQSLESYLNPFQYDERIEELLDELKVEFWKVAEESLTDLQKRVIKLRVDGYTQMEIADILDVNQSSVTKCINGNIDYKNGKKVYGGVIKKMKKAIMSNPRILEIFHEIDELRSEKI